MKRVEKHIISSGYCSKCKRRKTAQAISPQACVLGENVKKFITYLVIVMRISFGQVKSFMSDTAGLYLSDGEIVDILDEQAQKLTPERNRLLARIRGAPGRHYDETGWKVQHEGLGNYCWVNRSTEGEDSVFLMGRSRGKGNAEELQGEAGNQVGISDDYGAYDNLFAKHQLCMAHPHRKLRDLRESKILSQISPQAQASCIKSYETFSTLYADLEQTLATQYQGEVWLKRRDEYLLRLREVAIVAVDDPDKLKKIKQSLNGNAEKYFTCLLQPGIPADNNKAERVLRHLVIKRKKSMGSKTAKGAEILSIFYSVVISLWRRSKKDFFSAYSHAIRQPINIQAQ